MHSKPTKQILYHCPEALYPKLQAMSQANSRSVTLEITAAIEAAWSEYVKTINQTLPVESENENAS